MSNFLFSIRNRPVVQDNSVNLGKADVFYEAYQNTDLFGSYFTAPLRAYQSCFLSNKEDVREEKSIVSIDGCLELIKELALVIVDVVVRMFLYPPALLGIYMNQTMGEKIEGDKPGVAASPIIRTIPSVKELFFDRIALEIEVIERDIKEGKRPCFHLILENVSSSDVVRRPFDQWRKDKESKIPSSSTAGKSFIEYQFSFNRNLQELAEGGYQSPEIKELFKTSTADDGDASSSVLPFFGIVKKEKFIEEICTQLRKRVEERLAYRPNFDMDTFGCFLDEVEKKAYVVCYLVEKKGV